MKQFSSALNKQIILTRLRLLGTVMTLTLLAACGGGGAGDGTGDEANTTPPNSAALMAVEPLVGVWNLPGNWRPGETDDEAYLLIRPPNSIGVAEAIVYDFDDASTGLGQNCFSVNGLPGTVSQSLSNELFMDISAFPDAVVSLDARGNLVIVYFEVSSGTSDSETTTLVAERLGITETDITPQCSF